MKTIKQTLSWAKRKLKNSTTKELDALVLLSFVLKKSKEKIIMNPNVILSKAERSKFEELITRRLAGEPIAYLVSYKEFYGLDFLVTPDVLIPRPETELMIDEILEYVKSISPVTLFPYFSISLNIADVGTGSGAIAITLAKYLPKSKIFAFDSSKKALEIAKKNKNNILNPEQRRKVTFFQSNLLSGIRQKFDIICANLPYLTEKEFKSLKSFEPKSALVAGKTGLEVFQKFIPQLKYTLKPRGMVFLEIGYNQAEKIKELIKKHLPKSEVRIKKDLQNLDRLVIIKI